VFYDQLLQRTQSLPGVASASLAGTVPPSEISGRTAVFYPGQQPADIQGHEFDPNNLRVDTNSIGPGFFRTMGMSILRGRDFTLQDREIGPKVAIVNDRLAERLWPGEDAIGKRLAVPEFAGIADPNVEIVGVARSTKNRSLLQTPQPILYLPVLQRYGSGRTTLVVRTAGEDPGTLLPELLHEVPELDKNVPVFGVEVMAEHVGTSLWQQQIAAGLIGLFGVLAAVLASVGLYGIVSNGVAERTREIGIRLALGSQPAYIRRIILKQSCGLVFTGIGLGIAAALGLTGLLSSLLYEISPHDSMTFTTVCMILCIVAFVASEIPTRRAFRIDPVRALRQD
jgi:predicted permease